MLRVLLVFLTSEASGDVCGQISLESHKFTHSDAILDPRVRERLEREINKEGRGGEGEMERSELEDTLICLRIQHGVGTSEFVRFSPT